MSVILKFSYKVLDDCPVYMHVHVYNVIYVMLFLQKEKEVKKQTKQLKQQMVEGGMSDATLCLEDGQYHTLLYMYMCAMLYCITHVHPYVHGEP